MRTGTDHHLTCWTDHRLTVANITLAAGHAFFLAILPWRTRLGLANSLHAHLGTVVTVFAFTLVALSVVWSAGMALDSKIFLIFNVVGGRRRPWLDRGIWALSQLGSAVAAFLLAALFLGLHRRRTAIEVVLGTLTLWLVVETAKVLTDRARPFLALAEARIVGWKEPGRSFPSGHTSQAMFMATLLGHGLRLGVVEAGLLYVAALLVGLTRMYVGAHYPRDVIGGFLLGGVWGILAGIVDSHWGGGG